MSRKMWSQEERQQAQKWENRCEEIGGESYTNTRQLNCQVGDTELRVDKKSGAAVINSSEHRNVVRDVDRIRGYEGGIIVKKQEENSETHLKLDSDKPASQQNLENAPVFDEELVESPR